MATQSGSEGACVGEGVARAGARRDAAVGAGLAVRLVVAGQGFVVVVIVVAGRDVVVIVVAGRGGVIVVVSA